MQPFVFSLFSKNMELKQAIQGEAKRLGFARMGVTTPDPPEHYAAFEAWLEKGRHAGMAYLAKEEARRKRADPRQLLPECRSILVLTTPYFPACGEGAKPGSGRVAAYAWGEDYHETLPGRLKALVEFIEAQVGHGVPNRWYTDTGPILERDLAQRAGLGWIGKNTCLIDPSAGSYFFLAEMLLGIELETDAPFLPDRCGACRRCIDACPTECILPDRTLDAGRCISYLTIELKGEIPGELRNSTQDWVFGCDVCQQVCPWNRFSATSGDPAFTPREGVPQVELTKELKLTVEEFNRKFKGSAVRRAKRGGYLRNVAVALGNAGGDAGAVRALQETLLNDPDAQVRGHAAWALGKIGSDACRHVLETSLAEEKDVKVLAEIQDALKIM